MTAPLHRRSDLGRVDRPDPSTPGRQGALARWQAQLDAQVDPARTDNREDQLDAERLRSAFDREQDALERWLKEAGEEEPSTRPRVVVVHRHEWLQRRLAEQLGTRGWQVLDGQDQAAEAVAALVVQQPQVLVTSDRIAGGPGLELVGRTRELSPDTVVVVQVDQDSRCADFVAEGAHVVVSHRATWQELVAVVDELAPSWP
jgi:CheY-like chemotaxis protein